MTAQVQAQPQADLGAASDMATAAQPSRYHEVRFAYHPRRAVVWSRLCAYLQRWVDADQALLELGAGYGEFSRFIQASAKWGLDVSPELTQHWAPEVTPLIQSALEPTPLPSGQLGSVFASNFFEHFTLDEGAGILSEAQRVLRPGGKLIVVQPNFRLEPNRYFDDYTHKQIYSDVSFCDFLQSLGWTITHCEPRFMPFTMKSRMPTAGWLVSLYLSLPYRPLAGQFMVVAERP